MALLKWLNYEGVDVFHVAEFAYCYTTDNVSLDADGSPRAYHPKNIGLDANGNAGWPTRGWRSVLVVDPADKSRPYVQPSGPTAGYFVSKTSLYDHNPAVPATEPAKYVDSEEIPYIVFPGGFYALEGTGHWGDLVMVRNLSNGRQSAAVVADGGPTKAPLGEMSLALADRLGGKKPNPRTGKGAPTGYIQYVVFPGSRANPAWPLSLATIDAMGARLLQSIGGWPS
ncbi:MAG: glycoside hydrolase family 75 protein [Hyphomicrobiales bacterium]|nr:glycoside hydrolase family 75 protein [Hyphomicrobiales bacterium]